MLSHAALIPMPLPKHGKHKRRCENRMLAPYFFPAKHCMPAGISAQSKRRWLLERKQRRRFWPPDNRAHPYGERIGELDSPLCAKNGKLRTAKAVIGTQRLAFQQRCAREGLIITISSISWSRAAWRQ